MRSSFRRFRTPKSALKIGRNIQTRLMIGLWPTRCRELRSLTSPVAFESCVVTEITFSTWRRKLLRRNCTGEILCSVNYAVKESGVFVVIFYTMIRFLHHFFLSVHHWIHHTEDCYEMFWFPYTTVARIHHFSRYNLTSTHIGVMSLSRRRKLFSWINAISNDNFLTAWLTASQYINLIFLQYGQNVL